MADRWEEREQHAFEALVERLQFWGYDVPAGEKLVDPALLLMLKTFAYHSVQLEKRLEKTGDEIIDTLISNFFMTGVKRPVPAFTMLSLECSDEHATIGTDMEFICTLPGIEQRGYSFYPLYPQEIHAINSDVVIYINSEDCTILRATSKETEGLLQADSLQSQHLGSQRLPGGSIYVGITSNLDLSTIKGFQLYTGPDLSVANILCWADWCVCSDHGDSTPFMPGQYEDHLEIFQHLDIREFEINSAFQSRLYSSDFLTSGKLLWHYKHYLAPAKCFAWLPVECLNEAGKVDCPPGLREHPSAPPELESLQTPRYWLRIDLKPDERINDLRKFSFFETNTLPVINRQKKYRNKYTMGQPVIETSLFELEDEGGDSLGEKLFSLDNVWDSNNNRYANVLDLDSYENKHKFAVFEDEGGMKIKFDFRDAGEAPPDYVVIEYSVTEGEKGNQIGGDVPFQLAENHPQVESVRNLITSQGGSGAKSPQEVKRLVGFFLRNHGVAVSEREIEYLARNFDSRIAAVSAGRGINRTPGGLLPSVAVEISFRPDIELTSDEQQYLLQRLREYLDSYTPINLHLTTRVAVS